MIATLTAAAIIPAYENIAMDLGTTIQRVSYLTSLQIAILGGAPLFWKPLSNRYGRRPIWFISFICTCLFNIGCALSHSYASMAACRALAAFFISPASAIGTGVVTETFFKKQRGKYLGIWTLMVTLGVPVGPFIFGFVAYHVGYRWIYWILAIVCSDSLATSQRYLLTSFRSTVCNWSCPSSCNLKHDTSVKASSTKAQSSNKNTCNSVGSIPTPSPFTNSSSLSHSSNTPPSQFRLSRTPWSSSSHPS